MCEMMRAMHVEMQIGDWIFWWNLSPFFEGEIFLVLMSTGFGFIKIPARWTFILGDQWILVSWVDLTFRHPNLMMS